MLPSPAVRGRSGLPVRRRAAALATVLGALTFPSAAAASARVHYVDGASVGGRCSDIRTAAQNSAATPWCSVAAGLAKATPGSRVLVRAGAYPRVVASDVRKTAYVTLAPHPGETPRIAGFTLNRVDHLRFDGLRILGGIIVRESSNLQFVGNEIPLRPDGSRTPSGLILYATKSVLVHRNHVANGRDGVNILGSTPQGSTDIVIWDNHFEKLGNDVVHIGTNAKRILVAANFMDDCRLRKDIDPYAHADGIQAMAPTEDVIAWGNYVAGGRGFLFMVSPKDEVKGGYGHRNTVVANNVFVGRDFAVRTASVPGARIVNNTIWGTSTAETSGLDLRDRVGDVNARSTDLVVVNNIAKRLRVAGAVTFAKREDNLVQQGAAGPQDLLATPTFADRASGDMRLVPGTIGVDDADPALAPPVDIEGRLRQATPDIGAYETDGPVVDGIWLHLPADVADVLAGTGAEEQVEDLDSME